MSAEALIDLTPLLRVALFGGVLVAGPLAWVWLRHGAAPAARMRALTLLSLFLTFDLVLFGAYTRLSDSGLGCPDWPGCYGSSSPLGAQAQIESAQNALPSGPVTHRKAWIEMLHRYLAAGVGVLIVVIALASWLEHRRRPRVTPVPWLPSFTLLWVCMQGAFGALTVTMKLYPAIVTAHLLGGLGLLALLAVQTRARVQTPLLLPAPLRLSLVFVAMLCVVQVALGGWVSANYAVLACTDFPTCQGSWWPDMDFAAGFVLKRELGIGSDGAYLPFAALTAIHYAHRLMGYVVLVALGLLAWRLRRIAARDPALRSWALAFALVALWQLASGLANVVLGWPLVAALAHTAGAAALVMLFSVLLMGMWQARAGIRATNAFAPPARAAS